MKTTIKLLFTIFLLLAINNIHAQIEKKIIGRWRLEIIEENGIRSYIYNERKSKEEFIKVTKQNISQVDYEPIHQAIVIVFSEYFYTFYKDGTFIREDSFSKNMGTYVCDKTIINMKFEEYDLQKNIDFDGEQLIMKSLEDELYVQYFLKEN